MCFKGCRQKLETAKEKENLKAEIYKNKKQKSIDPQNFFLLTKAKLYGSFIKIFFHYTATVTNRSSKDMSNTPMLQIRRRSVSNYTLSSDVQPETVHRIVICMRNKAFNFLYCLNISFLLFTVKLSPFVISTTILNHPVIKFKHVYI